MTRMIFFLQLVALWLMITGILRMCLVLMMYMIGINYWSKDGMLGCVQVIESEMVNLWRGVRQGHGCVGVLRRPRKDIPIYIMGSTPSVAS